MITPSTVDILDIVENTLERVVKPDAQSVDAKSALATIGHLLRVVRLRIGLEGQMFTDDIAALRAILPDTAAWLEVNAPETPVIAEIRTVLAKPYRDAGTYPDLLSLAAEAGALRRTLTNALEALVAVRAQHGEQADYQALRTRIRTYIQDQIRAEAPMIDPAYEGKGPRR